MDLGKRGKKEKNLGLLRRMGKYNEIMERGEKRSERGKE